MCALVHHAHWEKRGTDVGHYFNLPAVFMVPMHPEILEKLWNFTLNNLGLEIYLNFVKNPGIFYKILEKSVVS